MEIALQKISESQIEIIQDLAQKIWPDTFNKILTPEQIEYMLQMMYSREVLASQLENGHIFLLAFENNLPIGFMGLQAHHPTNSSMKVHKLYVLPEMQGKGIGRILLDQAQLEAKDEKCKELILNVNRFNKAVNFYERYGFQIIKEEDIDIGEGFFMNDYVMKLGL